MAMNTLALKARNLHAHLGHGRHAQPVLHGVSVDVPAGQWLSIVGPNGAGKSTLLRCLGGLLPCSGSIELLGRPLAQWPARDRARTLAWLGQGGAAASAGGGLDAGADDLTAYDIALLGRLPHHGWWSPPGPADHAAVERALKRTQAWDWACKPLGQLSGGERQRVLLARALAVEAQVLLMDEPLTNLDPPHQADWLRLVRELVAQGHTVVSVLHELTQALAADQVLVLQAGRAVAQGAPGSPVVHDALHQVFEHQIGIHRFQDQWVALPKLK
ncbi:ABC transporter ATP-binding protein [Hydrogenophaga soli]